MCFPFHPSFIHPLWWLVIGGNIFFNGNWKFFPNGRSDWVLSIYPPTDHPSIHPSIHPLWFVIGNITLHFFPPLRTGTQWKKCFLSHTLSIHPSIHPLWLVDWWKHFFHWELEVINKIKGPQNTMGNLPFHNRSMRAALCFDWLFGRTHNLHEHLVTPSMLLWSHPIGHVP